MAHQRSSKQTAIEPVANPGLSVPSKDAESPAGDKASSFPGQKSEGTWSDRMEDQEAVVLTMP